MDLDPETLRQVGEATEEPAAVVVRADDYLATLPRFTT